MKQTQKKVRVRYDRLLKLAKHLESGKLGHKVFDFGTYNSDLRSDGYDTPISERAKNSCGTNGCAIGECPIVFSRDWEFRKVGAFNPVFDPVLKGEKTTAGPLHSASTYFDISYYDSRGLFIPNESCPWNKDVLGNDATKKEVAAAIRRFVSWKTKKIVFDKEFAKFEKKAKALNITLEVTEDY